jgi:hypothetical protein
MNIISYNANFITSQVVVSAEVAGQVRVLQCTIGEGGLPEQFTANDLNEFLEEQNNDTN